MSEHTKTPWGIESTWSFHTITDPCGDEIAEIMTGADGELCHADQDHELIKQNEANARHIVHCVNNYDRLVEMVRALAYDYHNATGGGCHNAAHELLAELDTKGEE